MTNGSWLDLLTPKYINKAYTYPPPKTKDIKVDPISGHVNCFRLHSFLVNMQSVPPPGHPVYLFGGKNGTLEIRSANRTCGKSITVDQTLPVRPYLKVP